MIVIYRLPFFFNAEYVDQLRGFITRVEWEEFCRSTSSMSTSAQSSAFNERFNRPERASLVKGTWPCQQGYRGGKPAYGFIGTERLPGNSNLPMRDFKGPCILPETEGPFEFVDDNTVDHPGISAAEYSDMIRALNTTLDTTRNSCVARCNYYEPVTMILSVIFLVPCCWLYARMWQQSYVVKTLAKEMDRLNAASLNARGYQLLVFPDESNGMGWPVIQLKKREQVNEA